MKQKPKSTGREIVVLPSVAAATTEIKELHESLCGSAKTTLDKAIRIGELLTEIKGSMKSGDWLLWVESNLPFTRATAANYMRCYRKQDELKRKTVLHPSAAYKALANAAGNQTEEFTGDQESYTPSPYIEAARQVMGSIDLDPASNPTAQKTVKAARFFSKKDDGLSQEWAGSVFLNPPYSHPEIEQFVEKLISSHKSGAVPQAILLTNDQTDTKWFHLILGVCSRFCLLRGRINFYKGDGKTTSPTNGQTFFYFGSDAARFAKVFGELGDICRRA